MKEPKIRFKGFSGEWVTLSIKDICDVNPKSTLPIEFEYVDLDEEEVRKEYMTNV